MLKPDPLVSHFEVSILIPIRIVDDCGQAPKSMMDVAASLLGQGWCPPLADQSAPELTRRIEHQAYSYFHPFVRRFLFDQQRVIRLARTDLECLTVKPGGLGDHADCHLEVMACELWLFQRTEIGVLKLDLRKAADAEDWALSRVQRLLDQVRRLYPPYFDGSSGDLASGGHCPREVVLRFKSSAGHESVTSDFGDVARYCADMASWSALGQSNELLESFSWATHWQAILEPLVTSPVAPNVPGAKVGMPTRWRAMQLGDDRAATMSFVAFANEAEFRRVTEGDWVRLCFSDAPGDDRFPCQDAFLNGNALRASFQSRFCYDRFFYAVGQSTDSPSRILNCGYSFTYAGSKADPHFFMNFDNGAIVSFRHIYLAMGVLAQFQRAALLASSFRISCLVKRDVNSGIDKKETAPAYDAFLSFTQWYWFDEISPQEQGQDLFAMWRRELRLQELFTEVRQELRDIVDLQNAKQQIEQAETASKLAKTSTELTRVAVPFAILSITIALLSFAAGWMGMNVLTDDVKVITLPAWLSWLGAGSILAAGFVALAVSARLAFVRWPDIKSAFSSTEIE